jgi:hypothetical protein
VFGDTYLWPALQNLTDPECTYTMYGPTNQSLPLDRIVDAGEQDGLLVLVHKD